MDKSRHEVIRKCVVQKIEPPTKYQPYLDKTGPEPNQVTAILSVIGTTSSIKVQLPSVLGETRIEEGTMLELSIGTNSMIVGEQTGAKKVEIGDSTYYVDVDDGYIRVQDPNMSRSFWLSPTFIEWLGENYKNMLFNEKYQIVYLQRKLYNRWIKQNPTQHFILDKLADRIAKECYARFPENTEEALKYADFLKEQYEQDATDFSEEMEKTKKGVEEEKFAKYKNG